MRSVRRLGLGDDDSEGGLGVKGRGGGGRVMSAYVLMRRVVEKEGGSEQRGRGRGRE